jgi:hypothetical protein
MNRARPSWWVVAVLLLAEVSAAQPSGPDTRPTTRPASAPASDPSTPKGALRMLNAAMAEGDGEAMHKVLEANTPSEKKMADAIVAMAVALADVHRAAVKAFGEERAKEITGDTDSEHIESLKKIDSAEIAINGDTATVKYPDDPEPHELKKVKGQWKVPLTDFGKPPDDASLDQRLSDLSRQQKLAEKIAREIDDGKYETAEKAAEAWHSRILELAVPRPSTGPVGDARNPR